MSPTRHFISCAACRSVDKIVCEFESSVNVLSSLSFFLIFEQHKLGVDWRLICDLLNLYTASPVMLVRETQTVKPVFGMIGLLLNCIVILILILGSELYHDTDT